MLPSHWNRTAFTLVELLVVLAIVGILIAMLLPAVQQVREAARRTDCGNHLRQVGLATQMFHDNQGAYPPARLVPAFGDDNQTCRGPASWAVHLLPFIEQQNLHDLWDFSLDYEDQPEAAVATPVQLFLCSSRHSMSNANAPDLIVTERGGGGG